MCRILEIHPSGFYAWLKQPECRRTVAESFFSFLKTERIKRKIYKTRNEAGAEVFNYIEFFYNPSRRHGNNDGISPVEFEKQYYEKLSSL